ncbi:DUF692 family multinuclear iron-containing protein [Xenorhabdus lircayensis]|uniref:DUF692 family protein n=1 Tax=Xenorhabdus lircayensis TaxID=2763499 RepID=A0ABS0U781_9GAMM|nr:DUF692 family protein [Xenorhabdus lircayensis]
MSLYIISRKRKNAIKFIKKTQEKIEKSIWIENANFYSSSPKEIYNNWQSFNHILDSSEAKAIIDLSHLIIDCKNNNIEPSLLIGFISWEKVIELHLSGIHCSKDGTLHDGHNVAISPMVWDLLKQIHSLNLLHKNIYINIEHSDKEWQNNQNIYDKDFMLLEEVFYKSKPNQYIKLDPVKYARNYLKKIIKDDIENFSEILEFLKLSEAELFNAWFHYIEKTGYRISLSEDDMDTIIATKSQYIINSFSHFIEEIKI